MMFGRRKFIRDFSLATAGFAIAPNLLRGDDDEASKLPESRKIFKGGGEPVRLGFVGTGLMGGENMHQFKRLGQLISAYCDVDTKYGFGKARKFAEKGAPYFVDYREMFEKMRGKLDGIVISTPDHSHYAAAICALRHGFPIYLEKPMCHTIWQIRELAKFAKERNSITQMGNIVHAGDGIRICWEWINAGLIGKVRRVVIWTDRPLSKYCNQRPGAYLSWPPSEEVPPELDWDKWQNVESVQGFSSKLHPLNWRRFWKYGTGSLGDIGCHMLDVPISALELGYPKKVVARSRGVTEISVSLPTLSDKYAQEYGSNDRTYRYFSKNVVTVCTGNVETVLALMPKQSELLKKGIMVGSDNSWDNQVQFQFEGLNGIKPEMIEDATRNAREAAEKFAKDSDSRLGKIKTASQGTFTISDRDSNTPYIKKVRVVSSVTYYLKN